MLLFVNYFFFFASEALSHCKHDTGALSWLNLEPLKRAPTPLFDTPVRCSAHGRSFTRLQCVLSMSILASKALDLLWMSVGLLHPSSDSAISTTLFKFLHLHFVFQGLRGPLSVSTSLAGWTSVPTRLSCSGSTGFPCSAKQKDCRADRNSSVSTYFKFPNL